MTFVHSGIVCEREVLRVYDYGLMMGGGLHNVMTIRYKHVKQTPLCYVYGEGIGRVGRLGGMQTTVLTYIYHIYCWHYTAAQAISIYHALAHMMASFF